MLTLNIIRQNGPNPGLPVKETSGQCVNPRRVKYTYDYFLHRARQLNGNKYNYGLITPEMVSGFRSKVPIVCNTCNWQWDTNVDNHLRGRGCPMCAGRVKWTRPLLIEKAKIIHGNKYNYDNVTHNISNNRTYIIIVCNNCSNSWETAITSHINAKSGCPRCSKVERCTYNEFI